MSLLLLVLNHDAEPLLEVFLHAHTTALKQVLNAFNLILQFLQLVVLLLVRLFVHVDLRLQLVFLLGANDLTVVIDHAS